MYLSSSPLLPLTPLASPGTPEMPVSVKPDLIPYRSGDITWLVPNWVSFYGLIIFIGMLASILTIAYFWRRQKYPTEILITLIIITIPSAILGARLWFIFEELSAKSTSIANDWWKINEGGLSIQGGVVVPTILNLIYISTKRDVIDYRQVISFVLPAVLIGQAIGRWGNYMNHELYGFVDPTGAWSKWLGPIISSNMYIVDELNGGEAAFRVPLFFYESIATLFGYILIVWIFNFFGWFKPGVTGGFYLIYYGIVRASMEYLRKDAFLLYLIMSIIFVTIGLAMFLYFQFFGNYVWVVDKNVIEQNPQNISTINNVENSQKLAKNLKIKPQRIANPRYKLEKYKIMNMTIFSYVRI